MGNDYRLSFPALFLNAFLRVSRFPSCHINHLFPKNSPYLSEMSDFLRDEGIFRFAEQIEVDRYQLFRVLIVLTDVDENRRDHHFQDRDQAKKNER